MIPKPRRGVRKQPTLRGTHCGAATTFGLFVITLVCPQWIELIFRVDPDQGSGALEWAVLGAAAAANVLFIATIAFVRVRGATF